MVWCCCLCRLMLTASFGVDGSGGDDGVQWLTASNLCEAPKSVVSFFSGWSGIFSRCFFSICIGIHTHNRDVLMTKKRFYLLLKGNQYNPTYVFFCTSFSCWTYWDLVCMFRGVTCFPSILKSCIAIGSKKKIYPYLLNYELVYPLVLCSSICHASKLN